MRGFPVFFALMFFVVNKSVTEEVNRLALPPADVEWSIIGAGPAGVFVTGLLQDLGIRSEKIMWVDPEFSCGRMGEYYNNVPGNAKTKAYVRFISACKTFQGCKSEAIEKLKQYDQEATLPLSIIVEPLKDITKYMLQNVRSKKGILTSLQFVDGVWRVGTTGGDFTSNYVILATGARPKILDYDCKNIIPLDLALNKNVLASLIEPTDRVAVVGSAHSAVLCLKFLSELNVAGIVNFYKKPITYSVDTGTIVYNDTPGLKGITAEWARNILEKNPPANLIRIYNTPESLKAWLPICNKIIYAIGYEKNPLPPLYANPDYKYEEDSGTIAPRLFGIGIAFPEKYTDPFGKTEWRASLRSFMEYAMRIIPQWMTKAPASYYEEFEDLFIIDIL